MTWWQDILKDFGSWLFIGGGLTVVFGVGKAVQKRRDPEITATQVREDAATVQSDQQIKGAVESYAGQFIDSLKADIASLRAEVKGLRDEVAVERAARERAEADRDQARTTLGHLSDWVRDLLTRWDELRAHADPPSGASRYLQN